MSVAQVLARTGPRKLLALDGGGIRGVITLQILQRIEAILRAQTGNSQLVLADYFDYIAGTSIGAVVAACLALGKSVDDLRNFYLEGGRDMFTAAGITQRFRHKFTPEKLTARLKQAIGEETTLGNLGNINQTLNRYSTAIECYEAQLQIAEEVEDTRGVANAG
jgi:patatin-like phospholipase/acyl hydrolase